MAKILITDAVHPMLIAGLEERNYTVDYLPDITYEKVKAIIQDYEGIVINSKIICNQALFGDSPTVKWIARLGSGLEVIDANYCKQKNIFFFNTPEGNRQAVAEHALGLLLAILNNIPRAYSEVKNNHWIREANRGEELNGKTIAIIGYGNTGSAFAKVLSGFDVKILAYDKYIAVEKTNQIRPTDLPTIFSEADIVSLHLPLTAETTYFANSHFFSNFKKPIYFINTSRGKIVNQQDLIIALQNKQIKGTALDVLENEKLSNFSPTEKQEFEKLVSLSNVIITPHIAGWTHQSLFKIAETLLAKLDSFNDSLSLAK